MALAPGTRLGAYAVLDLIGAGGMGEVYKARDTRLDRLVALKVLPPDVASDPDRRARFAREAKAISQLSHPHICALYDVGVAEGDGSSSEVERSSRPLASDRSARPPYLVMEHLEGETLAARLDRGVVPLEQALRMGAEIADALSFAHRHGIVHRDLKPGNVMLTASGVKLLDFGLAKLTAGYRLSTTGFRPEASATATESLTTEGKVLGTVPYMAPEQIEGQETDARTDIFALGCVLYELVTGRRAFAGETSAALMSAILKDEPAPLSGRRPLVPPALEHVVRTCLAKDPEERWQSAADVKRELSWIGRTPVTPTPIRLSRRSVLFVIPVILMLLAAMSYLVRWFGRGTPVPGPVSIAVVDVENLSDSQDQDSLGRILRSLVNTELARSPDIQVVSSQRVFDIARQLGRQGAPVDRSVATDIATRAGADRMLLGQVARSGEGLVATAELVEVESGRLLGSYRAAGRTVDDIFSIAEALGQGIRRDLQPGNVADVAGVSPARELTRSIEAYRAFVRGQARLELSDYAGAVSEFGQAVQLDPEFALGHYLLSRAARNAGQREKFREAALSALALADRLPASYRDLLRAETLPMTSRNRVPLLEAAVHRDPTNVDALYVLSEVYAHSPHLNDPERAVALRERLFLLGHIRFAALEEQAQMYALMGQPLKATETVTEIEARWPLLAPYTRAWLSAFSGQADAALRELEQAVAPVPVVSAYLLSEIPEIAGRWDLAQRAVSGDLGEGQWQMRDLRARGQFFAHRGAFDRAREAYSQAAGTEPLAQHPGWTGCVRASVFRALAELDALRGDVASAREQLARALTIQPESPRWLFFAGRLAVRAGDLDGGREILRTLQRLLQTSRYATRDLYRDALEAEVLLANGQPELALPLAETVVNSPRRALDYWADGAFASAAFRDTLVRILLALGRRRDAAQALEQLVNSGFERVHHPLIYVPALYTLGRLRVELGDQAGGERLLSRFLEHWGDARWDLPEVADARRCLAELQTRVPVR